MGRSSGFRRDLRGVGEQSLITEIVKRRVLARMERGKEGCVEELLVVTRTPESNGTMKYDYPLKKIACNLENGFCQD